MLSNELLNSKSAETLVTQEYYWVKTIYVKHRAPKLQMCKNTSDLDKNRAIFWNISLKKPLSFKIVEFRKKHQKNSVELLREFIK